MGEGDFVYVSVYRMSRAVLEVLKLSVQYSVTIELNLQQISPDFNFENFLL